MIKRIFLLLLTSAMLFACSSSKKTRSGSGLSNTFSASTPKPTDDGLSFATAIVITEKTSEKGISAEYKWIKEHYSDYKVQGQSLIFQDNKPYDVITITLANGQNLKLYFDISNFFGKF